MRTYTHALVSMLMSIVVLRIMHTLRTTRKSRRRGKIAIEHESERTNERERERTRLSSFSSLFSRFFIDTYALVFSHSLLPLTATIVAVVIIIATENEASDFLGSFSNTTCSHNSSTNICAQKHIANGCQRQSHNDAIDRR